MPQCAHRFAYVRLKRHTLAIHTHTNGSRMLMPLFVLIQSLPLFQHFDGLPWLAAIYRIWRIAECMVYRISVCRLPCAQNVQSIDGTLSRACRHTIRATVCKLYSARRSIYGYAQRTCLAVAAAAVAANAVNNTYIHVKCVYIRNWHA